LDCDKAEQSPPESDIRPLAAFFNSFRLPLYLRGAADAKIKTAPLRVRQQGGQKGVWNESKHIKSGTTRQ